jgi:Pentapeptide repeats (8 copies)
MQRNTLQERYEQGDRNFQKADLSGIDLSGLDLREADFRGADLYGTQLMNSLLCRADFSEGTNLGYAKLQGADLSEANLSGANLEGAGLEEAIAQRAIYDQKTVFPVGFDIKAAGGIEVQELERQSRIESIAQLKSQAAQSKASVLEPVVEPQQTSSTVQTSVGDSTAFVNPDDSGYFSSPSTPTPVPIATTPPKSSGSCLGIFFGMFLVLGLGFAALNPFKSSNVSQNPFESVQYPRPACGDPLPTNASAFPLDLYPVFVEYSSSTLNTMVTNFCRDAFATTRTGLGDRWIQVASFNNKQRATQFAQFMQQKVGSGEVGTPTRIPK